MSIASKRTRYCIAALGILATTAIRAQDGDPELLRAPDGGAGALLTYDMATGEERMAVPGSVASSLRNARVAGSSHPSRAGIEATVGPQTFGRRSTVTASHSPWSRNVKLFIEFSGKSIEGSGIMIDSKHVLTAGRCVYDRHAGGWAKRIVVAPAYDGRASKSEQAPFGYLQPKSLQTFDAWKKTSHFEHDIGLIELARPVGALTGWCGYGYDNDCEFFTKSNWYRASYPAAGGYDGKQMYAQSGKFDRCRTVRVAQYNNKSYAGEAGSGFYTFLKGARYVFAVHSGYSPHGFSLATRIDRDKFTKLQTWIRRSRSAAYDLTPLGFRGQTIVSRHQPIRSASFLVHNDSTGSFDGPIYFSVHLSTDRSITKYDRELADVRLPAKIGPQGSLRIHWGGLGPVIPGDVKPGRYYVGVLISTRDWNNENQHTLEDDVLEITVPRAGFLPYGHGCDGSNGRLRHTATSSLGRPVIGKTSRFALSNGPVNSFAGFTLGVSNRRWGAFSLPLDLSGLGATGCQLYVAPLVRLWMRTDARGRAAISLAHRNSRAMVGFVFFTQYIALDRRANALGLTYSNGVRSEIGDR